MWIGLHSSTAASSRDQYSLRSAHLPTAGQQRFESSAVSSQHATNSGSWNVVIILIKFSMLNLHKLMENDAHTFLFKF